MRRVVIIGSNGAGKSTFSFRLAARTGLPLIHADQIYWRGCWEARPRGEFETLLLAEVEKPAWIIEGNNIRSLEARLARADTVFWFELPPLVCVCGILRRELHYWGRVRPDLPDQCRSRLDLSFLHYAWRFNKANRQKILELLAAHPNLTVIHFRSRRQAGRFLDAL